MGSAQYLNLGGNSTAGTIPKWSGLRSLSHIELWNNRLTGTLPEAAPNLLHLELVNVAGNDLSGTLPEWLGFVSSLQEIYTDNNANLDRSGTPNRDNYAAREVEPGIMHREL